MDLLVRQGGAALYEQHCVNMENCRWGNTLSKASETTQQWHHVATLLSHAAIDMNEDGKPVSDVWSHFYGTSAAVSKQKNAAEQ